MQIKRNAQMSLYIPREKQIERTKLAIAERQHTRITMHHKRHPSKRVVISGPAGKVLWYTLQYFIKGYRTTTFEVL